MKAFKTINLGLALTAVLTGCSPGPQANQLGRNVASDGIIGGTLVTDADLISKSIVGLQAVSEGMGMNENGQLVPVEEMSTCTGTLISSNVVLTAAHCVVGVSSIIAYFGKTAKEAAANPKEKARQVTRIVFHKGFDLSNDVNGNDIALVQFAGTLPAGYEPATILNNPALLKDGLAVTLAGYGVASMAENIPESLDSDILRQINMKIAKANFSTTEILFDQNNGKGACHGDSGGPAFVKSNGKVAVVGVTSRGYTPSQSQVDQEASIKCERFVIYTKAPAYLDWIQKQAIPTLKSMKDGSRKAI